MKITSLQQFKEFIRPLKKSKLDEVHDQLTAEMLKTKSPAKRLGYANMLDELCIEVQLRKPNPADNSLVDEDALLAAPFSDD